MLRYVCNGFDDHNRRCVCEYRIGIPGRGPDKLDIFQGDDDDIHP